jgi:hypothetical protein
MQRVATCFLMLSLGVVSSAQAARGDWRASLDPAAVGSYVRSGTRVVVVAAGDEGDDHWQEVEDAAAELQDALRKSGRARVVLDGSVLGEEVGVLSDGAIVTKAARLPVDLVAVARVFVGKRAPSLVVTFYNNKNAVMAAFNVERGAPLAARPDEGPGGLAGVSPDAASSVETVLRDQPRSPRRSQDPGALAEYRQRYLGFYQLNLIHLNRYGGVTGFSSHLSNPYQGAGEQPLEWPAFFRITGHSEEATFFEQRGRLRNILIITGAVVGAIGLGVMTYAMLSPGRGECTLPGNDGNCLFYDTSYSIPLILGGAVGSIAGIATVIVGIALPRFKSRPDQILRYAIGYNQRLRRELGLSQDERDDPSPGPPESRAPARPSMALVPAMFPGGGGLGLAGRF